MSSEHVSKTLGVCGGKACLAGRRIRVLDIVVLTQERNCAPEEIVSMFSGVTLNDVHAALAYYFDNRAEVDDDIAREKAFASELIAQHPSKVMGNLSD